MSDGSMLIKALAIILFLGVLFSGIAGSFASEEELNNNWVSNAGIDNVFGVGIDIFKFPISAVTIVIDFFDGDFWDWIGSGYVSPDEYSSSQLNGTGTDENEKYLTLDGNYDYHTTSTYSTHTNFEFSHEEDTGWLTRKRKIEIDYDRGDDIEKIQVEDIQTENITNIYVTTPKSIGRKTVYNASNIAYGNTNDILDIDFQKIDDSNYSNNASGIINLGGEIVSNETHEAYKTNAEQVFNFFDDKIKPKVKDGVKSFGLLPEVIGIPIFILLLIGIIYAIIKLFPWT